MNDIEQLNSGINPPEDINVVIEIPKGSNIKYEYDITNGILYADKFYLLHWSIHLIMVLYQKL